MEFNCLLKFGDACEPSSEVVVSLGELGRSMLDEIEIYPDISKELDSLRAIVSGLASKPNVIICQEPPVDRTCCFLYCGMLKLVQCPSLNGSRTRSSYEPLINR